MSTNAVDVLPSWTTIQAAISSTAAASINHISMPVSSTVITTSITTTSTTTPSPPPSTPLSSKDQHQQTAIIDKNNINKQNSNNNNNNNNNDTTIENIETTVGEVDSINSVNSFDEQQYMTPRSPTTSLTSLPPLPDLIPIRKSNINHQTTTTSSSSSSSTPASTTTSASVIAKKLSTITKNNLRRKSLDLSYTTESQQIDEINSDKIALSSHNLNNSNSTINKIISPIRQVINIDEDSIDENEYHQHSNTIDQETESINEEEEDDDDDEDDEDDENDNNVQDDDHEKEQTESVELIENIIGETSRIEDIAEDIMAPESITSAIDATATATTTTIISPDNQSTANMEHQKNIQKKRGRPKGTLKRKTQEIVQHRKSDRRRVERDIFFLFEEHPSNRRRVKKCQKGQKRGPGRPRKRFIDTSSSSNSKKKPTPPSVSSSSNLHPTTTTTANSNHVKKRIPPVKLAKKEVSNPSVNLTTADNLTPRVNPIFLWVKQDDTRIVEVRCEDYDKRNRIRLTRTPNGWRSIPRTDTSSSRVVKLVPNPLVRVKQELQVRPDLLENANGKNDVVEDIVRRMKKNKKKKKKKKRKHTSDQEDDEEEEDDLDEDVRKLLSPSPKDVIVYESTNHERDEDEQDDDNNTATLQDIELSSEPNNNEMTDELTKNLTQISDDIELDIPFMHHLHNDSPIMSLCPQTGVFQAINQENQSATISSVGNQPILSSSFDPVEVGCHDVDTKHLKDLLLDDADLLQHGAELIDSLVQRGCEDNHISEDEGNHPHQSHLHHNSQNHVNVHQKNSMCLSNDFENEDDDILMQPEPVEDIISRLGESLAASPKCLSFNEVGEIEGLHGELFQTTTQPDPFNRTTLEELSITIKDLEKSSESFAQPQKTQMCDTNQRTVESTTTIVSPDSCVDELPKDLTCKKAGENLLKSQPCQTQSHTERSHSRSSDAIQSPQPSGLPAVPPSPDLMHSKNKTMFLDQLLNNSSASPKICSSVTVTPIKVTSNSSQQQKEPLDLGKHRKSASPTVSCSEEAKRSQPLISSVDGSIISDEPLHKKIKTEPEVDVGKGMTDSFIELFSSGKDPDPLTQLRLLISNPEWKVPDPILVPKDRLSAVLASPAREIPHLLTTRPELRLPDAFAYPSILQDPDILVIPLEQLETILQKQLEVSKSSKPSPIPHVTIEAVTKKRMDKSSHPQSELSPMKKTPTKSLLNPMTPLVASGLANEIDAATFAAFNQMLWLPYLGQMAPELFKAMAGLPNTANLAEMLPYLAQQQQQQQQQSQQQQQHQQQQQQQQQSQRQQFASQFNSPSVPNPMAFQNSLEIAMLQGALSQAQMQRAMKMNTAGNQRDQIKKNPSDTSRRNNYSMGPLFAQKTVENARLSQQQQQQQQQQNQPAATQLKGRSTFGINPFRHQEQNRAQMRPCSTTEKSNNLRQMNPYYPPHTGMEISPVRKPKQSSSVHHQNEQKPRVTCKSLTNLLQPERLMQESKMSNLMAMPQFDFNQLHSHHQQQQQQQQHHQQQQQQQNPLTAHLLSQSQGSHQSHYSNHSNLPNLSGNTNNNSSNSNNSNSSSSSSSGQTVGKLKVKPAPHLLDPAAMQRRLLNYDEIPEVGSTTNGVDDIMNDPNAHLWHPLFGSTQKTGYTSPWQWTTVTATGE